MMRVAFILLFLAHSFQLGAQPATVLHQAFLDLKHDGVLMNISAHPDDEDGATLAYYRMKYGAKTHSVFFTRGEGGQNEKGPELYEALGVIRTQETYEAAAIQGTEAFFLNLKDFGYSKTATETFEKWGGSREVLRRLVYFIRLLKPDIMFTHHNTVDGHGHHQAVGITAIAAFDAAADPLSFPEQLLQPGVHLWQPRKLFFRNFGRTDQTADVVNMIDEVEPIRGVSYMEIASEALRRHKTQGMDRADLRRFTRGISLYRLVRTNGVYERDTTSFFGGINFYVDPAMRSLRGLRTALDSIGPELSRPELLMRLSELLSQVDSLTVAGAGAVQGMRLLFQWRERIEYLASTLCDLHVSLTLSDTIVVARQKVRATMEVRSSTCTISRVRYSFNLPDGWVINEASGPAPVISPRRFVKDFDLVVGERPMFTLPATTAIYNPIEARQEVVAMLSYSADGFDFTVSARPRFDVAPMQTLTISPSVSWMGKNRTRAFEYTVKNYRPHKVAGQVKVELPSGWSGDRSAYVIEKEDGEARGSIRLTASAAAAPGSYTVRFKTEYVATEVKAVLFDTKVASNIHLGIVKSYDNTLESVAGELGVQYRLLDSAKVARGDLSRYTTIVVDIRAYLVRGDISAHNERLLEYVRQGGNLVVMYQRDQEWKPEYAPYPFNISRQRISVEEAPVNVLEPAHPLMNSPNRITEDSWNGWVQERGVYFPTDVPEEYIRLIESGDPNENPLASGYIVAAYGKGSYIYTSLVWYRQLKEANAGAYKCFANMISYPAFR